MEVIKIAGVSCKVDRLNSSTYESLFNIAKDAMCWNGVKDAKKKIDKELREHGFKPTQTDREQTQADNTVESRTTSKKGNTRKRKRNSKPSKE